MNKQTFLRVFGQISNNEDKESRKLGSFLALVSKHNKVLNDLVTVKKKRVSIFCDSIRREIFLFD